jgi:hypothetical protein
MRVAARRRREPQRSPRRSRRARRWKQRRGSRCGSSAGALRQRQTTSVETPLLPSEGNTARAQLLACPTTLRSAETRQDSRCSAAVEQRFDVSTSRGEGGWAGCRCPARGGQRSASAVGQHFNVSRGWGLTAISSPCRCRTTFQRFAATGADRDDHGNGTRATGPAQLSPAVVVPTKGDKPHGIGIVGSWRGGDLRVPQLSASA